MLVLDSCHDLSQSCSQCITEVAICMVRLPKDFSTQKYVLPNLLCSYQGILSVSTKRACPTPQYHVNDFPLYWFCKCKSNNYNSLSFEKEEMYYFFFNKHLLYKRNASCTAKIRVQL